MISLGIESTAHTFGVGILKNKKILANEKLSYTTKTGGIIPSEAAKHHKKIKEKVLKQALNKASLEIKDIDLISFSQSPGLAPCLIVGKDFAINLAKTNNLPIVGVNHCCAHIEIGRLTTNAKDPVLLYASGANTQIIAYEGQKYRIFGETLDHGAGNALDTFARNLKLGFPGGPKVYELAKKSKKYIKLPYSVKGMDVSFSGMLTFIQNKIKQGYKKEDLAYSLQETMFAMLLEVSERALAHCQKNELLLGGGVACNKRLQEMAKIMCKERKAKCFIPENQYLVDNAAMISYLGLLEYNAGHKDDYFVDIKPYLRTDEVDVIWRK